MIKLRRLGFNFFYFTVASLFIVIGATAIPDAEIAVPVLILGELALLPILRRAVLLDGDKMIVRNGYTTRHFRRREIQRIELADAGNWASTAACPEVWTKDAKHYRLRPLSAYKGSRCLSEMVARMQDWLANV